MRRSNRPLRVAGQTAGRKAPHPPSRGATCVMVCLGLFLLGIWCWTLIMLWQMWGR